MVRMTTLDIEPAWNLKVKLCSSGSRTFVTCIGKQFNKPYTDQVTDCGRRAFLEWLSHTVHQIPRTVQPHAKLFKYDVMHSYPYRPTKLER